MKTVMVRIVEWTSWLPMNKDPHSPLYMAEGVTGFETEDTEKVLEIAVTSTGQARHIPVETDDGTQNQKHGLYAFQAVVASHLAKGVELPESPVPEGADTKHVIIDPKQPNRDQRRSNGKKRK